MPYILVSQITLQIQNDLQSDSQYLIIAQMVEERVDRLREYAGSLGK